MFGFYNYNKPGKGVQPRDPNQSRISLFFELFFGKLWALLKVNLAYAVLMLPTFLVTMFIAGIVSNRLTEIAAPVFANAIGLSEVDMSNLGLTRVIVLFDLATRVILAFWFTIFLGMGPATAGITYILRNYAREEHAWLWSDSWERFRSNFKQAILLWIIDLIAFFAVVTGFAFYAENGGWGIVATGVMLIGVVLYLMMHIYVYQMMITFELPFKNVLKNSMILAVMTTPKTLLLLIILAAVHIGLPYLLLVGAKFGVSIVIFIALEVFFLPAASMFMTNFFIYPTVETLIKKALAQAENAADEAADSEASKDSDASEV